MKMVKKYLGLTDSCRHRPDPELLIFPQRMCLDSFVWNHQGHVSLAGQLLSPHTSDLWQKIASVITIPTSTNPVQSITSEADIMKNYIVKEKDLQECAL